MKLDVCFESFKSSQSNEGNKDTDTDSYRQIFLSEWEKTSDNDSSTRLCELKCVVLLHNETTGQNASLNVPLGG